MSIESTGVFPGQTGSSFRRLGEPAHERFRLHAAADIRNLPPAEWLMEGMVEVGAQGVVFGPTSQGKTFVVLDWALCVASGRPWQGHTVKQGPVVYVVAEGGRGIRKRIAAWMQEHDVPAVESAFFLLEAVQLLSDEDFNLLISRLQEHGVTPSLIVLDTFARCFVGGDENSSDEVGEFIDAAHRLRQHTGASVVLVHHTGKSGDQERGSSALRAAADAMFRVSRARGEVIEVKNEKQKDEEECPTVRVRLKRVVVNEANGETSCVVVAAEGADQAPRLAGTEQAALTVLLGFPDATATSRQWRERLADDNGRTISPKTFDNWRLALIRKGFVEAVPGDRHTYRVVVQQEPATVGVEAPANAIDTPLMEQGEQPNLEAATATTP